MVIIHVGTKRDKKLLMVIMRMVRNQKLGFGGIKMETLSKKENSKKRKMV